MIAQRMRVFSAAKIFLGVAPFLFFVFEILASMRVDLLLTSSWRSVFAPLFALAGCLVGSVACMMIMAAQTTSCHNKQAMLSAAAVVPPKSDLVLTMLAGSTLISVCLVLLLYFVLYAVKLDLLVGFSWPIAFIPIFILLLAFGGGAFGVVAFHMLNRSHELKMRLLCFACASNLLAILLQMFFVAFKLEGTLVWYWWQVCLPLCVSSLCWLPMLIEVARLHQEGRVATMVISSCSIGWALLMLTMVLQALNADGIISAPSPALCVPLLIVTLCSALISIGLISGVKAPAL
eukprot:TRINITY_DN2571_c0_g1_i2.p1 TRINITY_DN2571_c0_g1~~TRINITY_DN2571_c0_g1_i2.p1  ORF type:complete len:291 (+),score=46.33 TRINITY_DN2571_c0_g1_i2:429-1301(+)